MIASMGPAPWNAMSITTSPWSMWMSPKTCMSITPSSKITAPTTINSVPAPPVARQIRVERLSAIAAAMTAR